MKYEILKSLHDAVINTKGGITLLCAENGWSYPTFAQKLNHNDSTAHLSAYEMITSIIFCESEAPIDALRKARNKDTDVCTKEQSGKTLKEMLEASTELASQCYLEASTTERNRIDKELREARDAIDKLLVANKNTNKN